MFFKRVKKQSGDLCRIRQFPGCFPHRPAEAAGIALYRPDFISIRIVSRSLAVSLIFAT